MISLKREREYKSSIVTDKLNSLVGNCGAVSFRKHSPDFAAGHKQQGTNQEGEQGSGSVRLGDEHQQHNHCPDVESPQ